MSEDLIRYDILAQEALRGVIRKVLDEVARAGLPGDHHFFITFQTTHPGVRLSKRMRERYPEEMTIVIQHTFWNLEIGDTAFEIDLSFDDIRERLRVPFAAIRGFFDPSVKFGLQFDIATEPAIAGKPQAPRKQEKPSPASVPAVKPKPVPVGKERKSEKTPAKESADVVSLDTFRKKK